ncbi:MAG: hypothetical protein LBQ70_01800 [Prevotellaceae bacterium]|jgi:hypothetical protein|nr:hypothetical protein [Prevotellaceae bacterium]
MIILPAWFCFVQKHCLKGRIFITAGLDLRKKHPTILCLKGRTKTKSCLSGRSIALYIPQVGDLRL